VGAATVVWSPEALAERDAGYAYIAEHSGPARAYAVLRRVSKAAAQLEVFPESGRLTDRARRELVVSGLPYVIEYELDQDVVRILHIRHTSRGSGQSPGEAADA
jgi:toxin ParE1/3/4